MRVWHAENSARFVEALLENYKPPEEAQSPELGTNRTGGTSGHTEESGAGPQDVIISLYIT